MHVVLISPTKQLVAWFAEEFQVTEVRHTCELKSITSRLPEFDAVVFCDGEKVPASMFNQHKHSCSRSTEGEREDFETNLYWEALRISMPCIGMQRGATFLSVHNAADVFQFVSGHMTGHRVKTTCGGDFVADSAHNDMVDLRDFTDGDDVEIHAWAEGVAKNFEKMTPLPSEKVEKLCTLSSAIKKEPEVWSFPYTKTLCIQGKPESYIATPMYKKYCMDLVKKTIGVEKCAD